MEAFGGPYNFLCALIFIYLDSISVRRENEALFIVEVYKFLLYLARFCSKFSYYNILNMLWIMAT